MPASLSRPDARLSNRALPRWPDLRSLLIFGIAALRRRRWFGIDGAAAFHSVMRRDSTTAVDRPFGHSCTPSVGGRHVCWYLQCNLPSCILRLGPSLDAGADLLHRNSRRGGAAPRGHGARRKAEAQTERSSARSSRPSAGGAGYPGRAARYSDRRSQPGTEHHLRADGHGADNDQSRRDPGASARHERHGREDRAAGPWRYPGFGRQRQFPRAQRARQCADPHQRHHAPGRRQRLRHLPRYRVDRQHIADYRRVAAAIRPAHLRRSRYPDARAMPSTIPDTSASMAAAGEPSRRASSTAAQSDRRNTSSLGGSSRAISGWKIRRRTGTRSTIIPRRSAALAMSRPCSIPTRGSPSWPAPPTRAFRYPTPLG